MDRRFLFALLGALLLCGLAICEEEIDSLTDDIATDDAPLEVDEDELADPRRRERYRFGIKSSPGVSYEVIKQRMTWSEAERVCNKRYGHLATITSTVMNGELVARLHKEGVDSAWMGYNDIKRDGSWQWVNPSSACQKFTFWNNGEPNGRTNENCGQLYSGWGGHWNDNHCNNKLGFVCEYGATPAKICSHNGDRFTLGGMSYQVVPKKMTWGQAQNNCKKLGGHLATITSATYNAQLVFQLRKRKVDLAWIGYNDKKHDGIWVWVNPASRCEKFTNWNPGEPNGHRGENCGQVYSGSGGSSGRWNDLNCDRRLGSICEIGSRRVKRCQITPPPGMRFKVGGILYGVVTNHFTWNEAENNCKRYGGHLATITSAKQNAQIVANLHSRNVNKAWMGYNDIKADGSWKWANPSSSCKKFTFWNHGEPNGGTNENCGQLYRYYGGRWNDLHCDNKLASVCEYGTAAAKICRPTGGASTGTEEVKEINCGFGCIAGAQHKVKSIRHSKENTQHDCAHNCCVKKGCIGFDYNTATKDCWLSGTSWSKIRTSKAESARMTCHKASASDDPDIEVVAEDEGDLPDEQEDEEFGDKGKEEESSSKVEFEDEE